MWPVTVLPLARIGTVVSSPCNRSAVRTWRSISACSGCRTVVQAPTWSASVDTLRSMPSALPVQRLKLAELLEQDHGQKVRSGEAPRRDVERRRRLRDRLAFPAREPLPHRLDHLPLTWDHLQCLGDVLPQLRQLRRPAAGTAFRRHDDDALARQMVGEWFAGRPLALKRFDRLRPCRCFLGRQLILGRCRFQVFQLKFHLLQQPSRALRAAAVKRPAKLLDLKLEMGDQHFRAGVYRLRASRNGFGFNPCGALGDDHRMRAGKIGWQRFRGRCHTATESYSSATAKQNRHPADVGRQVSCGWRQSIPDSKYPSCADEIVTAPSATLGHKNRPRSNRFVNRQAPWPSCQITFNRSPRRPRKQNRCPHSGSRRSTSCTSNDKLAKPFLISV